MASSTTGEQVNMDEKVAELRAMVHKSIQEEMEAFAKKKHPAGTVGPKFDVESLGNTIVVEKFLRARKCNLKAAHKMLFKCLRWRAEFAGGRGVESITRDECKAEIATGCVRQHGVDKLGRPVSYIKVKLHIPPKDPDQFCKFLVYTMESANEFKTRLQGMAVLDMEGLTTANISLKALPFIFKVCQNYYPECLGASLIINSPSFFSSSWNLIKTLLDPVVVSKIKFGTMADIPAFIDETQFLPHNLWGIPAEEAQTQQPIPHQQQ